MLSICQTGTLPNSPDSVKMVLQTAKATVLKKTSTEVALYLIIRPNNRPEVAMPASRLCPVSSELSFTQFVVYYSALEINPVPKQLPYVTDVLKIKVKIDFFYVTEYYKLCCVGPVPEQLMEYESMNTY